MLLVSEMEFHRFKQNDRNTAGNVDILSDVKQPNERELVKTYTKMEHALQDPSLSDQVKVAKHVEAMNDFTVLRNRVTGNVEQQLPHTRGSGDNDAVMDDAVELMPLTLQKSARQLLERLSKRKDLISWNANGEVTMAGKRLAGSHIGDLVGGVLRTRKTAVPSRGSFLNVLAEANVPDEFIRNKTALVHYRRIKIGDASKRPPGLPQLQENDVHEEAKRLTHSALLKKRKRAPKVKRVGNIKWKNL